MNRGAGERALTADEIAAKFMENAELALSRERAERIRDFVLSLESHSARELGRCSRGNDREREGIAPAPGRREPGRAAYRSRATFEEIS